MIVDSQCYEAGGGSMASSAEQQPQQQCYSLSPEQCFGGGGGGMAEGGGGSSYYTGNGGGNGLFCQPTPSPADSGVMSPMTPMSSYTTGSTPEQNFMTSPEHLTGSSFPMSGSGSPFNHPSPADSGFNMGGCGGGGGIPSPYPLTSPGASRSQAPQQLLQQQHSVQTVTDQCCGNNQYEQCGAWASANSDHQQMLQNAGHVNNSYLGHHLQKLGSEKDKSSTGGGVVTDITQLAEPFGGQPCNVSINDFPEIDDAVLGLMLNENAEVAEPRELPAGDDEDDEDDEDEIIQGSSEDDDDDDSSESDAHPSEQQQQQHPLQMYQQQLPAASSSHPQQQLLQQGHFSLALPVSETINRMDLTAGAHQRKWVSTATAVSAIPLASNLASPSSGNSRPYSSLLLLPTSSSATTKGSSTSAWQTSSSSSTSMPSRLLSKRKKSRNYALSNKLVSAATSTAGLVLQQQQQQHFRLQQQQQQQHCQLSTMHLTTGASVGVSSSGPDMDHLYINCTSNVSPDSGIQSEGVASSSPLHLGDGGGGMTNGGGGGLVINNSAVIHGHQGFHPAFHGNAAYTTTTAAGHQMQSQQQHQYSQLNMWNTVQQQHSPAGNYYGQFIPQQQPQQLQHYPMLPGNGSNAGYQQYQHHNGSASIAMISTATGPSKFMMQQQQSQPHLSHQQQQLQQQNHQVHQGQQFGGTLHHRGGDDDTPPPVLIPSVSSSNSCSSNSSSRTSRKGESSSSKANRGRGRPKGSKNKAKKVTMECGSQTEESVLDVRYSTDSDTSGGSLPPPSLPKFQGASSVHSQQTKCYRGRPRNNEQPPMLEPQIAPSVFSLKKFNCDRFMPSGGEKFKSSSTSMSSSSLSSSRQQHFKKKECEVIVLDSDEESDDHQADDMNEVSSEEERPLKYKQYVNKKSSFVKKKEKAKQKEKRKEVKILPKLPPVIQKLPSYKVTSQPTPPLLQSSPPSQRPTSSAATSLPKEHVPKKANMKSRANTQRSITPKSERDSSHSPARSPVNRSRISRQEAFVADKHNSSSSSGGGSGNKQSTFSFTNGEIVTIFDKKYHSVQSGRPWYSPEGTRSVSRSSNHQATGPTTTDEPGPRRTSSAESSRVLTKASLKEMSSFQIASPMATGASGGASTKTMLSVLAETNQRAKPGRKKRGRRSKSSEWAAMADSKESFRSSVGAGGASPGSSCHSSKSPFSPRSNPGVVEQRDVKYSAIMMEYDLAQKGGRKRKKEKKGWKSKHKNVIDPVFNSKVDYLTQDLGACKIDEMPSADIWPDRGPKALPGTFRTRKYVVPSSSGNGSGNNRHKRGSEDKKRGRGKRASKDEAATPVIAEQRATSCPSDSAEQRLPLKKRHHHNIPKQQQQQNEADSESGASSSALSPPPLPPTSRTKTNISAAYAAAASTSTTPSARSAKPSSSLQNAEMQNKSRKQQLENQQTKSSDISIIHEKLSSTKRPPTAADTLAEKLGIQSLLRRRKSRSGSRERGGDARGSKATIKILEENSERILGKYVGEDGSSSSSKSTAASLQGYSPSKPIPPTSSVSPMRSINSIDKMAAIIDKYTGIKERAAGRSPNNSTAGAGTSKVARNLSQTLTIDTTASSPKDKVAAPPPKSPRKRHLLEMQKKQQDDNDEQPPSLVKASSASKELEKSKEIASRPDQTMTPGNINSALEPSRTCLSPPKTSPPRLSPPHISPIGSVASPAASPGKLSSCSEDEAGGGGRGTANRWSVTSSGSSEDEKSNKRKRRKPTKYSDISDDDRSSGSLKIRLKREIPNTDDIFTRLQSSAPKKPVRLTPMIPLESLEQSTHQSPRKMSESDDDGRRSERRLTERQKALVAAKAVTQVVDSLPPIHKTPEKAKKALETESFFDLEREIEPLVVKPRRISTGSGTDEERKGGGAKVITPKILKSTSSSLCGSSSKSPAYDSGSDTSIIKSPKVSLQKCSVRVQKLTEQEIIESSPSPPNFYDNHDSSSESKTSEGKRKKKSSPPAAAEVSTKRLAAVAETSQEEQDDVITPSILKKRRRRSNKTGFPAMKKKRRPQSTESPGSSRASSANTTPSTSCTRKKRAGSQHAESSKMPQRSSIRKVIMDERKAKEKEKTRSESVEIIGEVNAAHSNDGKDVLSQAISQLRSSEKAGNMKRKQEDRTDEQHADAAKMKRPRGRPPKKRLTANSVVQPHLQNALMSQCETIPPPLNSNESPAQSRDGSLTNSIQGSDDIVPMNPGVSIPLISDKRSGSSEDYQNIRSRLYDDIDDEIDCLSILPPIGMESGQSSEAPSGTEADDNSRSSSQSKRNKKTALFKKSTLRAGLFSEHYKQVDGKSAETVAAKKQPQAYRPEDHPHGLLPPPYYCGRQLRQKREDFQLPYDLWWLHAHRQLPGRDVVATWNYKKIKNNIYCDVKPVAEFESQACHCKPNYNKGSTGCGEDCINRLTFAECDARLCPVGERCTNNAIQKHRSVQGTERFMTEHKGWGIKTKQAIQEGEFIMEYVGEVVSEKEFKRRMSHQYVEDTHHYCLHLDGGMVIDGHRAGGECRFVNHACEPNCEIQKWTVNGLYRMALFSLREIGPGEELTYDYNFSLFNPHEGQSCRCGSENCRGVIGGRTQRINGLLDKSGDGGGEGGGVGNRNNSQERVGRDRKKVKALLKARKTEIGGTPNRLPLLAPMKQLSNQQQNFVRDHQCFLLRNLEKVRQVRESMQRKVSGHMAHRREEQAATKAEEMILTGLTALATARSMQTRRLTIAQDDPNVTKVVKLAQKLLLIYAQVTTLEDENGLSLSRYFNTLPSKKKHPQYFLLISEPVDLQFIERNINSGNYTLPEQFDRDFLRLCQNNLRYYGHLSKEGLAAVTMRKVYVNVIKPEHHTDLEEIVGAPAAACFRKKDESSGGNAGGSGGASGMGVEDVICCPCSGYQDEGVMIQCEKCQVWQHCDCIGVSADVENHFCEKCGEREANLDIVLKPQPDFASPGETYYATLRREDLQVCVGDTVYVLRAFKQAEKSEEEQEVAGTTEMTTEEQPGDGSAAKGDKEFQQGGIPHKMMSPMKGPSQEASTLAKGNYPTYKTVDPSSSTMDMDIFRIERLWVKDGERFAFGHHYLRPQETFHEPNRKFFHNEVFRVPISEVLPLDSIWGKCWVLDIPTYCKGRPVGAVEEHVYICESRVDRTARLFSKISKAKYPVCTKWFAFDFFDQKLKPQRTYTPHEIPEKWRSSSTPRSRSIEDDSRHHHAHKQLDLSSSSSNNRRTSASTSRGGAADPAAKISQQNQQHPNSYNNSRIVKKKDREKQKTKLEATLTKLLGKLPAKNGIDATYLLESDKRLRKKTATQNSSALPT